MESARVELGELVNERLTTCMLLVERWGNPIYKDFCMRSFSLRFSSTTWDSLQRTALASTLAPPLTATKPQNHVKFCFFRVIVNVESDRQDIIQLLALVDNPEELVWLNNVCLPLHVGRSAISVLKTGLDIRRSGGAPGREGHRLPSQRAHTEVEDRCSCILSQFS